MAIVFLNCKCLSYITDVIDPQKVFHIKLYTLIKFQNGAISMFRKIVIYKST